MLSKYIEALSETVSFPVVAIGTRIQSHINAAFAMRRFLSSTALNVTSQSIVTLGQLLSAIVALATLLG
jgi:hypothetical protein